MNKNILYGVIKAGAAERDDLYKRFRRVDHPDAEKVYNFHNHCVNDLIKQYKDEGGKRDTSRFEAMDK